MIPKVAHFHWTGPPMSWLRTVSLVSFKRHNPDWEIVLHDTPPDIRAYGMAYGNEADWTWWRVLRDRGGFQVATDIVFTKPVPEEWLEKPLNACTWGMDRVYQFAMLGAIAGHPFVVEAEQQCLEVAIGLQGKTPSYQCMGVDLLERVWREADVGEFFDQSMSALCHTNDRHVDRLWKIHDIDLPDEAIGVHWYGGHPKSLELEGVTLPDSDSFLAILAASQMPPYEPSHRQTG